MFALSRPGAVRRVFYARSCRVKFASGLKLVVVCVVATLLQACGERSGPKPAEPDEPVRVLVVRLHGYVGCGVDAQLLSQSISEELARVREPIDAVVFWFDSSGGMLNRVGPLSDLMYERIGARWRQLAWVERAESAASLVALNIPEIWMPEDGLIGGALGVERDPGSGAWRALPEEIQQRVRYVAAACASRGGHDARLALDLVGGGDDETGGSAARIHTGARAEELGLARTASSLEAMLDRVFGAGKWEIDGGASASISSVIAAAEEERERATELQQRFVIAIGRAEAGEEYALDVADQYFGELLAISTDESVQARRVGAFLGLLEWVGWAMDRMEALSGEGSPSGV